MPWERQCSRQLPQGVYKDINEATRHMGSDIEAEYRPDEKRALIYEKLYKKYLELAKLAETIKLSI